MRALGFLLLALTWAGLVDVSAQGDPRNFGNRNQGSAASGSMELLTPTEGVDFRPYLSRLYHSVKRNWFERMPESVRLGERGKVIVRFQILPDGTLPEKRLVVESASGSKELREAATSAIKTSAPFESLPSAFKGPHIELRLTFLYNLPLSAAKP